MKHYFKEVIDPWLDTLLASMPQRSEKKAKRQIKLKLLDEMRMPRNEHRRYSA